MLGDGRMRAADLLDKFDEHDAAQPAFALQLATHAHFNDQLGEANYLEQASGPFVQRILVSPCARVPCMV